MVDSQQIGDVIDMDDLKETKKYSKKRIQLYAIINIITGIVAIIIQVKKISGQIFYLKYLCYKNPFQ